MNRTNLINQGIGAAFAVVAGVVIYLLTGTVQSIPKIDASVAMDDTDYPIGPAYFLNDKKITEIQVGKLELKKANPNLYDAVSDGLLSPEQYRAIHILANIRCVTQFKLTNVATAKAANINILMPDIGAFQIDSAPVVEFTGTKIPVGDLLPNEARSVKAFSTSSCPNAWRRFSIEKIHVSFDGGIASLDFFPEFGWVAKFVIQHELFVQMLLFLIAMSAFIFGPIVLLAIFSNRKSPPPGSSATEQHSASTAPNDQTVS